MINLSELFVIVYWMDWVGICLEGDVAYSTKDEAERKIIALEETPYAMQRQIKYKAINMIDYISEERKQAVVEAKYPIH